MISNSKSGFVKRAKWFCSGFLLVAIPFFLLSIFLGDSFTDACAVSISGGFVAAICAALFGKRVIDFLFDMLSQGWG